MALNGSIVITTRVDSGQATKDLESLIGRVQKLEDAQNEAAQAAANQAEQTSKLASASNAAGIAMGVFGAAMAAAAIGSIKLAADLEQSRVAFTTLLGSGEKARKFLDELAAFAASTPFEFKDLQDSSRRLLAFGFAAKDIIPIMNAVGSAVAGLGGGKEQIDRVTLALGQMQAKGKVSAEEMNQIAELGIPGWQMIASAIGKSIPEAMKLAEKGAIDSTTAINALITGMNEKFPGMLEKQSQTINGQLSNLRDGVTLTATLIGEKLINAFHIADAVGAAARAVSGFAQMVKTGGLKEALETAFPPGLKAIIIGIAGTITATLLPALGAAVVAAAPFLAIGAGIAAAAYLIIKNWTPVSAFFGDMFGKIGRMAERLRDTILRALGKPIVELGTISRTSMRLSQAGASVQQTPLEEAAGKPVDFFAGFKGMFSDFVPDLQKLMNTTVSTVANTAFTGLSGKAPALADTAASSAAAKAAAKKAEKEERERVKAHAKAISKIVTLPDTATPKEGGRFQAQTKDLELARKKATAANNGYLASQIDVSIINRKVAATEANIGKATAERTKAQIELYRLRNLTTVMTPADEKEYKKRVTQLTNFVKQRDKEVSDYRADLNDLEFERQVFIQERTANAIRSAYSLAFRLISGDFQSIFTDAATMIGSYVVNALANNPAIQTAIDGVTKSVGDTVSQMVSGLIGGGLDAAGAAVAGGMPGIMASFSSLGAVLAPLLPVIAAIGAAILIFQQVWDQNVMYIQENFAALGQALGYLWDSVMSGLQPVIDIVGSALSALAGPLTLIVFIADTVISAFTGIQKAVWDAINAFAPLKWIVDGISWVFNGVIDAVLAVVNWFRSLPFINAPALTRDKTTGVIGMAPPAAGAPTEVGDYVFQDGKWVRKSAADNYSRVRDKDGKFTFKKEIMPGERPDKPIYTQVVNVRDFRDAFPDSAYFRAPSVDTTRSLNANAVAYR